MPNRRCNIPRNRAIFMPIINWISVLHIDGETDEELATIARKKMDAVADLEVTLDGIRLKEDFLKFRAKSPFFSVSLPLNNVLGINSGSVRCLSDGYWVFFKPLLKYAKLSTLGSCSSGLTKLRINYDITIH